MKNTIKEIEEFFSLAIEQIRTNDNYGMPTTNEEWIIYVTNLGLQVNWILRDMDKVETTDLQTAIDLYGTDAKYYCLSFPHKGYHFTTIHYCQAADGYYRCAISNKQFKTYDLDELKAWITKRNTVV